MINHDDPMAYFLTWTIYGTHLQGDKRWWRKDGGKLMPPKPKLQQWHQDRLKYPVIILNSAQRTVVMDKIAEHCQQRNWKLWIANARTNHVHTVVTAQATAGITVRNQLKANCTIGLREASDLFKNRPVWTVGGDIQFINSLDDLEMAIDYAGDGQDDR